MNPTMIILIATAAFILGATLCFFVCRFARNGIFKKAFADYQQVTNHCRIACTKMNSRC